MGGEVSRVINFGCRLNAAESSRIEQILQRYEVSDCVVFNGCAVTAQAEAGLRQSIRRARKDFPDARLLLTGCPASISGDVYRKMPELDQVIANKDKLLPQSYGVINGEPDDSIAGLTTKTRAFLPVQNGCDHSCTFCIIPKGRGTSESLNARQVLRQVQRLADAGVAEVVLTGVDLGAWGRDLCGAWNLGALVKLILRECGNLQRLRLSSIDVVELDADLVEAFANDERFMPHFHLSLQAGSEKILKQMKRRHTRGDVINMTQRLRGLRPDVVFGADFIAGFPTETEADFADTLSLVGAAGIDLLHVFPFSARDGTPAARMQGLPRQVVIKRAKQLRELGNKRLAKLLAGYVGTVQQVLIEANNQGLTEHYVKVDLLGENQKSAKGQVIKARITDHDAKKSMLVAAA